MTGRRVYYVGDRGTQVIIYEDGTKDHPRLTPAERKELGILMKADKILIKVSQNEQDYRQLRSIPSSIGLNYCDVWGTIIEKKLKPQEAKEYLLELARYHGLLWRG